MPKREEAEEFGKEIFEVFFRRKPANILVALRKNTKNRYGSILAKEVDCTYSHAVKILQEMEKAKLVEFVKQGRIKMIRLTDSGNKVAEGIEKIQNALRFG
ncbi:winged helix DNA-binding protein [Candidatus Woesearchaeota archaeon]|nr:winged helix DNA-binding protein [Candidatus Woesearchaeota archaeon]